MPASDRAWNCAAYELPESDTPGFPVPALLPWLVRIVLDGKVVGGAVRKELGLFSKFDRDPQLTRALLAHGREQAGRYLALRA
jgi:hypothetical protein